MGAFIRIIHDNKTCSIEDVKNLSRTLVEVVSTCIGDDDVIVLVENPSVLINMEAVEVFIQVNNQKIDNPDIILENISKKLSESRDRSDCLINLNLIPVDWYSRIGI
mgnify:CR=1 FL=1